MPIYEYQCEACSRKLEKLQKMSDEPLRICPDCNQASLTRLISAARFRLKGGGWYETDFKTGRKKNVSGGASEGDTASGGSASGDTASGGSASGDSASGDNSPGNSSGAGSAPGSSSSESSPTSAAAS